MPFDERLDIHDDPLALNRPRILAVASRLRHLGIGILPMETVYVLTGIADNLEVQARMQMLRRYKQPAVDRRPFSILVSSLKDIVALTVLLKPTALRLLGYLLPGPVTVVLKANDEIPSWMCDDERKIWIRIPQHPLALQLAREIGRPLAVTRAAIYPELGSRKLSELPGDWLEKVDFIWDGGDTPIGKHSTVIEFAGDRLLLLRSGAYPFEELRRVCESEGFGFDWSLQDRPLPVPYRILFVCTENVCRSAMAEALLRHRWNQEAPEVPIAIRSAGLQIDPKRLPSPQTISAMQELGIDVRSHRPFTVSEIDHSCFDLILTMSEDHRLKLTTEYPIIENQEVSVLTGFLRDKGESTTGIAAPVNSGMEGYRRIRDQISSEIDRILPELILRATKQHNQSIAEQLRKR